MFQKKAKGLFAEVSPYQVKLARVDRVATPLVVEDLVEIPVTTVGETKRVIESFAGNTKASFAQARCSVYPEDRFLHRYTTESPGRTRQKDFGDTTLKSQLSLDPSETAYQVLHPITGTRYDPDVALSRDLLFAGANRQTLKEEQSRLIEMGIYPTRLEISSIPLCGGIRRAAVDDDLETSFLVIELSENSSYGYVVNHDGLALSQSFKFGVSKIAESIKDELGLQDTLSARKVMLSKTFDFGDMGSTLLSALIAEVSASTGQFEVQTGNSIHHLLVPGLPESLSWITEVLAEKLELQIWQPSLQKWLEKSGISLSDRIRKMENLSHYLPLFCQMANLQSDKK